MIATMAELARFTMWICLEVGDTGYLLQMGTLTGKMILKHGILNLILRQIDILPLSISLSNVSYVSNSSNIHNNTYSQDMPRSHFYCWVVFQPSNHGNSYHGNVAPRTMAQPTAFALAPAAPLPLAAPGAARCLLPLAFQGMVDTNLEKHDYFWHG